jgi:2-C-methyl-D-erythritol 4-phosphate cytidylyltransferase
MRGARVGAIVPAAGASRRMGGANKLFLPVGGRPLLAHTLAALQADAEIGWIVPVIQPGDQDHVKALVNMHGITKALAPEPGGPSRTASVARGFAALPPEAEWILVHDGARPCVRASLIRETIREARRAGAAAAGVPAPMTIKVVDERRAVRLTLDRTHLWLVQTPQVFRRDWFAQAIERAGLAGGTAHAGNGRAVDEYPDDAALVEAAGLPVTMVPGDPLNIKVTTPEDLVLVEAILGRPRRRTPARRDGRGRAAMSKAFS